MWTAARFVLAVVAAASLGCATGPTGTPSELLADVSGTWSGKLMIGPFSVLRCCGGQSGEAYVELEQDGTNVTGSFKAPGVKGTITAFVKGAEVSGNLSYTAGMSSGSTRFDARVVGNEMLAETLDSKLVLSRAR